MFQIVQLVKPQRVLYRHKEATVADYAWLGVGRDCRTDHLAPQTPHAVLLQLHLHAQIPEGLIQDARYGKRPLESLSGHRFRSSSGDEPLGGGGMLNRSWSLLRTPCLGSRHPQQDSLTDPLACSPNVERAEVSAAGTLWTKRSLPGRGQPTWSP